MLDDGCCDARRWRRLMSRRHVLKSGAGIALVAATVARFASAEASTPPVGSPVSGARVPLGQSQPLVNGSFVSPLVEIYGNVEIGHRSFIASNAMLYAADGRLISLGDETNVQDNVYLLATDRACTFDNMISIAHQAVIENSTVADFTFLGFRSRVRNAVVEEGAMVMHGAIVEGVTIPANAITPIGARIMTQAEADALPKLTPANDEFKHDVQHVNVEFASGYARLYEELGRSALEGVGPSPITS